MKFFPSEQQNHPFQAFLISKTYIYIYTCKKNLHKIERPLTARGGGKAIVEASAKNLIFFYVLPKSIIHGPIILNLWRFIHCSLSFLHVHWLYFFLQNILNLHVFSALISKDYLIKMYLLFYKNYFIYMYLQLSGFYKIYKMLLQNLLTLNVRSRLS